MTKKVFGKSVSGIFRILSLLAIIILVIPGCKKDSDSDEDLTGNWMAKADFEGVARSEAVAFTIGDKAYVGTGYDGTNRLKDFWEYDPVKNDWTRKADFPGIARSGAVGFGTDSKGYIGTGYDEDGNKLKDFWEYDPATDKWSQIPDFGGSARYGAVAFSINNKGYVGTGYDDNCLKDMWCYDPSLKTWTEVRSLTGSKRRDAVAFVINGIAYVCTGINNGSYLSDFYAYDPATDTWTEKRAIVNESDANYDDKYSGIDGISKAAFAVGGKGYVVSGGQSTTGTDTWEYDPSADLWTRKTYLEASARMEAVGFAIGSLGYVATGRSSSYYFDDVWALNPGQEKVDNDKIMIVSLNDYTKKVNSRL